MSTRVLTVRPAVVEDVPAMMAIYNHYVEISPATFDITPVSLENRLAWFGASAPAARSACWSPSRTARSSGTPAAAGSARSRPTSPRWR